MSVPKPLVRAGLRFARPMMHSSRVSLGTKRTLADSIAGAAVAPDGAIYDFDVIAGLPVQFVTVEGSGPAAGRGDLVQPIAKGVEFGGRRRFAGHAHEQSLNHQRPQSRGGRDCTGSATDAGPCGHGLSHGRPPAGPAHPTPRRGRHAAPTG